MKEEIAIGPEFGPEFAGPARPGSDPLEFAPSMGPIELAMAGGEPLIRTIAVTADHAAKSGSEQRLSGGLAATRINAKHAAEPGDDDPEPLPDGVLAMPGFIHIHDERLRNLSLEGGGHRCGQGRGQGRHQQPAEVGALEMLASLAHAGKASLQ